MGLAQAGKVTTGSRASQKKSAHPKSSPAPTLRGCNSSMQSPDLNKNLNCAQRLRVCRWILAWPGTAGHLPQARSTARRRFLILGCPGEETTRMGDDPGGTEASPVPRGAGCTRAVPQVTLLSLWVHSPGSHPRVNPGCSVSQFGMWGLAGTQCFVLPGAAGAAQDLQPSPPTLSCLMSTRAGKSPLLTLPGAAVQRCQLSRVGLYPCEAHPLLSLLMVSVVLSQACLGADSLSSLPQKP